MTNQYISRYAKDDTHFKHIDPWPLASFDEDDPSFVLMVAIGIGIVLAFIALIFLG